MATTSKHGWPRPTLPDPADIEVVGQALDAIDAGYCIVVSGSSGISNPFEPGTDRPSRSANNPVSFGVTFADPPVVALAIGNGWRWATLNNVSTSGFSFDVFDTRPNISGPVSDQVAWYAIGIPA